MSNAVVFIGMTYPHGIIRHFALLAVEIRKRIGCDFYFASTTGETNQDAWPMIRAEFAPGRILATETFPQLLNDIESLLTHYDRVLVHSGGGWGQTRLIAPLKKKYGARLVHVVTTHAYHIGDWRRVPASLIQNFLYRRYADHIVFQCDFAARRFVGGSQLVRTGKASIIPLGVEQYPDPTNIISELLAEQSELSQVLLDKSLVRFVYLAGFRSGKNHVWLMKAMASSLKRYPHARLLLCGRGAQEIISRVRDIAKKNGVLDQVIMPGQVHREAIPWVLQHASCAIVPSAAETFGHCYIEPMMAGLPVIGTRIGIGESVVQDFRTGMGISLKNPDSVSRAVEYIIEHPDQAREMGAFAQKLVKEEFTHESVGVALARLYGQLTPPPPHVIEIEFRRFAPLSEWEVAA